MELRRLRREARRQHNKDRCGEFDLQYPRLFTELQALRCQLETLGEVVSCTLPEPGVASSRALEAIQNNRDDEAVKAYESAVVGAREEIETTRHRIAARLVELRMRHRMMGSDLDRFRLERESVLATLQRFVSVPQPGEAPGEGSFHEEMQRLREVTDPTSVAWTGVAADDAASLASAETLLNHLRAELEKGRVLLEGLTQQSSEVPTAELRDPSNPVSFSDYWAKQKAVVKASQTSGPKKAEFSAASFEPLLEQAASLPTSDLYKALCEQACVIESIADPEVRRMHGEGLIIQGARQIREQKGLCRFRAEVQSMLDQVALFEELASNPLTEELKGLLASTAASDLGPQRKRHAAALEGARARREREAKRLALLDALRELGYQAGENMETAFTNSGRLLVHKRDDEEYAIELVADSSLDRVQTAMLRYSGSSEMSEQQRLRDREREASWCADHGKLRQLMARRGWESDLKMQRPPGEHPVRVVVDPGRALPGGATRANLNKSAAPGSAH